MHELSQKHQPSTHQYALELRGVSHLYPTKTGGQARGIHPISYRFEVGRVYSVKGENGAGKTTLFKLISGALRAQTGDIYLANERITSLPQWRRVRAGLGYLTQGQSLVSDMSVAWNLSLGIEAREKWFKYSGAAGGLQGAQSTTTQIDEALSLVGLREQSDQKVDSLSGGERRRAEFARLHLLRPPVLLLDEPFAAIDQRGLQVIIRVIRELQSTGSLILLTDHQTRYVDMVSDRSLHLIDGHLQTQGELKDFEDSSVYSPRDGGFDDSQSTQRGVFQK